MEDSDRLPEPSGNINDQYILYAHLITTCWVQSEAHCPSHGFSYLQGAVQTSRKGGAAGGGCGKGGIGEGGGYIHQEEDV